MCCRSMVAKKKRYSESYSFLHATEARFLHIDRNI